MSILANIARNYLDRKRLAELEREIEFIRHAERYFEKSDLGCKREGEMIAEADQLSRRLRPIYM